VFACYHALTTKPLTARVLRAAAAVELIHNVSLIVDDILDRSRYRRGQLSLHCRYGFLPALMTSGYIGFAGPRLVAADAYSVRLVAELMQRLGAAECFQWRLRRQPLGVEDWRLVAGEDTGTMFEICARLRARAAATPLPPRRVLIRRVIERRVIVHLPPSAPVQPTQASQQVSLAGDLSSLPVTRAS
jgi:geranylgeranyl pyrophosphate synthase